MIPKIRVFAKAGTKVVYGGGCDRDQMFYEIRDIDYYDKTITVWCCHNKDCGTCDDTYKMEDVEVMQYTGCRDKNGIEIYEGDIIKVTQCFGGMAHGGLIHLVEKSKYNNNLMLIRQSKQRFLPEVSLRFNQSEDYEVIGNIYENPELLEVAE